MTQFWGNRLRPARTAQLVVLLLAVVVPAAYASATHPVKPVQVSQSCPTGNAEPIQAAAGPYVYDAWMGCNGSIGFARSTDGGRTFGPATTVPFSDSSDHGWDPAVAVAPDGTVYVSYMAGRVVDQPGGGQVSQFVPAVAASTDHGKTFSRVAALPLPASNSSGNWGDRDFIAVGPDGTVYVTWDYGPPGDKVKVLCGPGGSCSFSAGEFNAVIQKSSDGGRTWTQPLSVSPGFPTGGVFSAPIVAEPNGRLDVLYWQHPTDPTTLALSPGREYFTRSTDGGATWSTPVAVDPGAGTIGLRVWWIDGSLAVDSAGNMYAAWDTQTRGRDTAWLAWSTDGGRHWSKRLPVTSSKRRRGVKLENLVEVAAAGPRDVYLGWQTVSHGIYATYLRRLSVGHGWRGRASKIPTGYGDQRGWPGDTIGISVEPSGAAVLSWGQTNTGVPDIYAALARLP